MSSTSSSVLTLSSFNLLFFTQVLTVLSITIKYNEYATDKGGNFSIPCIAQGNIMWVKEHGNNNTIIQTGRVLVLRNVSTSDSGIYVCFATLPVTTRRTTTTATTTSATVTTAIAATSRTITTATATATTTTTQAATIPATAATTSPQQQQQQQENEEKQEEHKQNVKIADDDEKGHDNEQVKQVEQVEEEEEELEYQAFQRIRLTVRTTPGPVTQLYFKASTILGFLIWRFNKTQSGGYPVRSFTAEYRNVSYRVPPANVSYEHEWSRMDPINIAPNVRQMEVYRLAPNTTYEFRIWANNELGSGEVVTTNVTTLPETKEEDLIRLIKPDLDNFDPRIWIVAVSIVLGTLVILAIGLCIVLSKECYQSTQMELQDGWDSIELIPNIILNPGFSESDGAKSAPPFTRTVIFGHNGRAYDDDDDDDEDYEEEQEPTMEKFKRKVSVFFTGPTIKRI
ncbi:contactin-2 isoform X1 [Drosophila sulfurigaster albostrigata]|uniref:contactin-2 isoform X1 n=1 Tax=Drosophila sulfurigaster albostrigata TaxID=89887 RepID=UPI002D21E3E4|nr:contactin-2 isoform X1 [Drosophila sulfurigaster albostrigata]